MSINNTNSTIIKEYNTSKLNAELNLNPTLFSHPKPIIFDSGASANYFEKPTTMVHVLIPFNDIKQAQHPITVKLPNNETIQSTHTAHLNIPKLPPSATSVHLFPSLAAGSLISISQL